MQSYLDTLNRIITTGDHKEGRNGPTRAIFGTQTRYDLREGFPLLTTKTINFKNIVEELVWFISGDTNNQTLLERGVKIWNKWAMPVSPELRVWKDKKEWENWFRSYLHIRTSELVVTRSLNVSNPDRLEGSFRGEDFDYDAAINEFEKASAIFDELGAEQAYDSLKNSPVYNGKNPIPHWDQQTPAVGELGPVYGRMWRFWPDGNGGTIDQLENIITALKTRPDSRRIYMSAWNPALLPDEGASHKENIINGKQVLPPCFLAGTLVSTPQGYRAIEDIKQGDIVYSATMRPRKVRQTWKTSYKGDISGIKVAKSPGLLLSTGNHPHKLDTGEFKRAEDIEVGEKMVIPLANPDAVKSRYVLKYSVDKGGHPKSPEKNMKDFEQELSLDDYYTAGYFLGNGWYMHNSDHRVNFTIPNHKVDSVLPRLRKTVKLSKKSDTGSCTTYDARSQKWGELFRQFGHLAHNKQIPEWVFDSPLVCIEKFVEGYIEADGCHINRDGSRICIITTVSRKLAFGVQRLLGVVGYQAAVKLQVKPKTTIIEGRLVNQRDLFHIEFNTDMKRKNNASYLGENSLNLTVRDNHRLTTVDPIFVYNLDVEEEHTYIANNFATHNCHTAVQFYSTKMTLKERVCEGRMLFNVGDTAIGPQTDFDEIKDEQLIAAIHTRLDACNVPSRWLDSRLDQRSADWPVGIPYNIASYSLFQSAIAKCVGMAPRYFIHTTGDTHVYADQIELAKDQVKREPTKLPKLLINPSLTDINKFCAEDVRLVGYVAQAHIPYPVTD